VLGLLRRSVDTSSLGSPPGFSRDTSIRFGPATCAIWSRLVEMRTVPRGSCSAC
jgi:hypothetical protein